MGRHRNHSIMTSNTIKDQSWYSYHPVGQLYSDYGIFSRLHQVAKGSDETLTTSHREEYDVIPPGFEKYRPRNNVSQTRTYSEQSNPGVSLETRENLHSFSFVPIMSVPDYTVIPFTRWRALICEKFCDNMCLCLNVLMRTNGNCVQTLCRLGFLVIKDAIADHVTLRMSSTVKLLKYILSTPGLTFALYDKTDNGIGAIMNSTLDENLTKMQRWFRSCHLFVVRSTWKKRPKYHPDLAGYAKYSQERYGDIANFLYLSKKGDIPAHMLVVIRCMNFDLLERMISYAMMKNPNMFMVARLCDSVNSATYPKNTTQNERINKDTPLTLPEMSLSPLDTLRSFRHFALSIEEIHKQLATYYQSEVAKSTENTNSRIYSLQKNSSLHLQPIIVLMKVSQNRYFQLVHY